MVDIISPNPKSSDPSDDSSQPSVESVQGASQSSNGFGFYNGFDRPDSTRINLAGKGDGNIERVGNEEYDKLVNRKFDGSVPPEKDFNNENISEIAPTESEQLPVAPVEPPVKEQISKAEEPKDMFEGTNPGVGVSDPAGMSSQAPHFSPVSDVPKIVSSPSKSSVPSESINFKRLLSIFFGGLVTAGIIGFLSYYLSGMYYDGLIKAKEDELAKIVNEINGLGKNNGPLELPATTTTSTTIPSSSTTTTTLPAVVPTTTSTTKAAPVTTTTTIPPNGLG